MVEFKERKTSTRCGQPRPLSFLINFGFWILEFGFKVRLSPSIRLYEPEVGGSF
jgi:hypothetical protein